MAQQQTSLAEMLLAQMQAVLQWLGPLTPQEFRHRNSADGWTVRHLIGHLLAAQDDLLAAISRPSTSRTLSLNHYLRRRRARTSHPHGHAAEVCGTDRDEVLVEHLAAVVGELRIALDLLDATVVDEHRDPVRVVDLLRVELAHWVAHGEDLRDVLPHRGSVATPRRVMADAVRLFTDALAKEFPGRSIELRVPPFAAVQLGVPHSGAGSGPGQGPSHTRGTPPNVVEMNAQTLLRLAAGSGSWTGEKTAGNLSASGPHADLRTVWPLLR